MSVNRAVFFWCLLVVLMMMIVTVKSENCIQDVNNRKFYKIKSCKRSDVSPLARTSVASLKACMQYARDKNGLAFNFSPPDAKGKQDSFLFNCQVLGCPELHNFTGLINDSLYDYYSSFGNYSALDNATCVKYLGMFKLFAEPSNYTEAITQCHDLFGDLAHVVSELRTNILSKLLITLPNWYKAAYVGLDDRKTEGRFETPLGDHITCYKYRAWSPGHPRRYMKSDDCVVLDVNRTWRVVNCKEKLPFLCELFPTLPEKPYGRKFLKKDCQEFEDSGEERECRKFKRNRKRKRKRKDRCSE